MLDGASGSPGHIPYEQIREAFESISRRAECYGYPGAGGPWDARVAYSEYASSVLRLPGRVKPENIIATAGAQHALHLIARVLRGGVKVAVESPGFIEGIMAFQAEDHKLLPFHVSIDGRVEHPSSKANVVYSVPSHHNPTGITYPAEARQTLKSLAATGLLIVEDDPYRPLLSPPPEPVWEPGSNVAYVSTLSKAVAPGLRAAFTISPDWLVEQLALASQHDFAVSTLTACVAARLIDEGFIEAYTSEMGEKYRQRLKALAEELDSRLPEIPRSDPQNGGFYLSVLLPCNARMVAGEMLKMNAIILPAEGFYIADPQKGLARISVAKLRVGDMVRYVEALRLSLERCRGNRR